MTSTIGFGLRARPDVRSWGAVAVLLLATSVAAAPPEDAGWLCTAGDSSLAASARQLTTSAQLFQASYSKAAWTGNVRAFTLNPADGTWTSDWSAASSIPDAGQRNIFTASSATTGVKFLWGALPQALKDAIGSEDMLNYLRGDQSGEVAKNGTFRNRSARLGAIVNSEIAYAGHEDFGYLALGGPVGQAYATVMLPKKATRKTLVIVGANDGMLHGFDATKGGTGSELFAYVPRTLLLAQIDPSPNPPPNGPPKDPRSTLVRLADPGFTARYYVDGSPWVGDAYLNGEWRTVVVGTTGAGGKGAFALKIPDDPSAMTATDVLWDIDGQSDSDMGYGFGQPVVGRLNDGYFYAIFGNGRESQNQCAVLYLVRLDNGQVRRIGTGPCGGNGLGRPSLYDVDPPGAAGYRTTDFVYAGDLKGNVWRFDLRTADLTNDPPTKADVQLLFTAVNDTNQVEPITGTIEIGVAPTDVTGSPTPAMLWFGTGRYFTDADRTDVTVQSMYGIVDRSPGRKSQGAQILRSKLQPQTINDAAGTVTGTKVDYKKQDGWYMNLPRSGERMIGQPLIQSGRLLFSTLRPEGNACLGSGMSWIFAVDPYHGLSLAQQTFVNYPGKDFIGSTVGIIHSLVGIDADVKAYLYAGGTTPDASGSSIQKEQVTPQKGGLRGRVSWREIVK